jgi:transposase
VASDIFGVSGRHLLQAMIAGQRDPKVLAQLARASMRAKLRQLEEALTGHFDDHHGFICRMMLERIDELTSRIEELTTRIDEQVAPFAAQVAQLDAVTGIGPVCAQELIAELGVDMAVFPTAAHLVAWAKFAPQANTSAGKAKTAATGKGNPWLAATLGEIAVTAGRTSTFLGERYRRIAKRRGTQRALVRGRQLGPDDRVAPAGRPQSLLPRSGSRLL